MSIQSHWIALEFYSPLQCIITDLVLPLKYPRLMGIGIQDQINIPEANLFKALVGRNAINFHAPSHSATIVLSTDTPEILRQDFRSALNRNDPIPLSKTLKTLMPVAEASSANQGISDKPGNALLIVGSSKVKSSSTSSILGEYILGYLNNKGWKVRSQTLQANLFKGNMQSEFLASIQSADQLIFAFPLYIDSLPYLMTKALELISKYADLQSLNNPKRLFVICNNGFPEATHSTVALAICQQFAVSTGMIWSGCLGMGGGEALLGGQALTGVKRSGRPPVNHVIRALDMAGASLAEWKTIPPEATRLIAKTPISLMPLSLWKWLFIKMGPKFWLEKAALNRITQAEMLARPYADT